MSIVHVKCGSIAKRITEVGYENYKHTTLNIEMQKTPIRFDFNYVFGLQCTIQNDLPTFTATSCPTPIMSL